MYMKKRSESSQHTANSTLKITSGLVLKQKVGNPSSTKFPQCDPSSKRSHMSSLSAFLFKKFKGNDKTMNLKNPYLCHNAQLTKTSSIFQFHHRSLSMCLHSTLSLHTVIILPNKSSHPGSTF